VGVVWAATGTCSQSVPRWMEKGALPRCRKRTKRKVDKGVAGVKKRIWLLHKRKERAQWKERRRIAKNRPRNGKLKQTRMWGKNPKRGSTGRIKEKGPRRKKKRG